jgi:hypothetical protein
VKPISFAAAQAAEEPKSGSEHAEIIRHLRRIMGIPSSIMNFELNKGTSTFNAPVPALAFGNPSAGRLWLRHPGGADILRHSAQ